MAIEKASFEKARPRWSPDLRLPGWVSAALVVALVVIAGGVGALVMAEFTGRTINVQLPGSTTTAAPAAIDTVTVIAVGRTAAAPDTVYADIGANTVKATLPQSLTAMTDDTNKLVAALKKAGIADADMQTTSLGTWPMTDSYGNVTGYNASTNLHVRIRDLSKATAILNAAAGAIGNDIRFNGLQYDRTDIATQAAQSRQMALASAQDRATAIAKGSNRQLDKIAAVQENYVAYVPAGSYTGGGQGAGGGGGGYVPAVQVGQGEVVVQLSVTYSLKA